jgi:hypothetical protein
MYKTLYRIVMKMMVCDIFILLRGIDIYVKLLSSKNVTK